MTSSQARALIESVAMLQRRKKWVNGLLKLLLLAVLDNME